VAGPPAAALRKDRLGRRGTPPSPIRIGPEEPGRGREPFRRLPCVTVQMVPAPAAKAASRELDEVTLRRAQRGEASAFRAVVEQYHRPVWELAVRMLAGSGCSPEDIAQETFTRVHRALPRFDPFGRARLSTWILTIASRLSLNALRSVRTTVPLDDAIEIPGGADPARVAAARQRAVTIARAISELPETARAVVILREYHDLDYDEIAQALEIDLGTVKSRLSRARAQLRERLAALAGESDE
jgi:RNA polymerase sigma-70 factor (ECF subfamily)